MAQLTSKKALQILLQRIDMLKRISDKVGVEFNTSGPRVSTCGAVLVVLRA
jgi:hypothetical protein